MTLQELKTGFQLQDLGLEIHLCPVDLPTNTNRAMSYIHVRTMRFFLPPSHHGSN